MIYNVGLTMLCTMSTILDWITDLKIINWRNFEPDTWLTFATVKIFTFIFTFYILLLSTVPCCAVDNCNDQTEQSKSNDTHKHNDDCKNCSPFALCGNCADFTITTNSIQLGTPQQLSDPAFPYYKQIYFPRYISSFWQPPKICWHISFKHSAVKRNGLFLFIVKQF